MLPTLEVAGDWENIQQGAARRELERSLLPDYLRTQRWFGGKGRRVEDVRIAEWSALPAGAARAFFVLLEVKFADGGNDLYFVPLGVAEGDAAAQMSSSMKSWIIARLTGPRGEALLHDALADDAVCTALLAAIGSRREWDFGSGRVRGLPTTAFAALRGDDREPTTVERGPATSSNTLIFFGSRLLLKLFRRLNDGINPDFEIGRFLTEETPFDRLPRVAGTLEYRRPNSSPVTLALLQARVANQDDGWKHALDELGRYYEQSPRKSFLHAENRPLLELAESSSSAEVQREIGDYLRAAETLGRRTAELHQALAAKPESPDFAPEAFTPQDAEALRASIQGQARHALTALRENVERLPEEVKSAAHRLLDEGPSTLEQLDRTSASPVHTARIRCHGDYHLGQVLRVDDDYVILDFEGEPARTVEERRAKQSPLKDVAGMIRSYHYAAYAGLFAFTKDQPQEFGRLEPRAERWFQWVSASFLRAYRNGSKEARFLPAEGEAFASLLDAFMLDKAFYELNYELNNRPDWVRIPLRGILALLKG